MSGYEESALFSLRVAGFCRFLKERTIPVSLAESIDALRAIPLLVTSDYSHFYLALRAILVKRPEDYLLFSRLFSEYWSGETSQEEVPPSEEGRRHRPMMTPPPREAPSGNPRDSWTGATSRDGELGAAPRSISGYSPSERLSRKQFEYVSTTDIPSICRNLRSLERAFASRAGRRKFVSKKGALDIPGTVRSGLSSGGELLQIKRKKLRLSRSHLVVVCDISGSMDKYSDTLIKILYTVQNRIRNSRVFVFSTRLVDLAPYLRGRSFSAALGEISQQIEVWKSGTRIGSALEELVMAHPGVLRPHTLLVIISDGWETGDTTLLQESLVRARASVEKIIWLNPLADSPDYTPITLGMQTALPFIDMLAGLRVLTDRVELARALRNRRAKPTHSKIARP